MLDLIPAARGTATAAQSFVALLITAFTFGVVAPQVLSDLAWLAWTSAAFALTASVFWPLSRCWQVREVREIAES